MPNRKITQFPAITAPEINDADLLTLVSVFEVDPALRNKKISFTDFRQYLDQYYINSLNFDPLIVTNLLVGQGLNVSGQTNLGDTLVVSGAATFLDNINISGDTLLGGDLSVAGTISGSSMDITVITTDQIEVQGTGTFITATGGQCNFITGNFQQTYTYTATGQNSNFVFGDYSILHADEATFDSLLISGITITGEFTSSGTINANNINATGTISGATITGDLVNVGTLNVQSGLFEYLSGETITGNTVQIHSGIVTNLEAEQSFLNQVRATGLYADNLTGLVTTMVTGYVQNDLFVSGTLSGAYITGDTLNVVAGYFDTVTGAFISGYQINAGILNVDILDAGNLSFSGDQIISGDLRALGNISTPSGIYGNEVVGSGSVSGAFISGISGVFQDRITAPIIDGTSGIFDTIIVSGDATITGGTVVGGDLTVSGNTNISGSLVVTGQTTLESGLSVADDVYLGSGLVVSGDTAISGDVVIHGGLEVSGDFQISGGDIIVDDLQVIDDAWIGGNLSVSGNTALSGTLFVSGETTVEDNLLVSNNISGGGTLYTVGSIQTPSFISGSSIIVDGVARADQVTGNTGRFTQISGQQGNFVSGTYGDLQVTGNLQVPFGDLTNPGLSFVSGNTVFDGILISKPNLSNNHVMTFVNQNTSGMSLTSGVNGFVLTIWGN